MRKNGFTLVEIVIGMGVMAMISLIVMSIFKSSVKFTKNSDNGDLLNNYFNEIRIKTGTVRCMASLGMGNITLSPGLEDTILGSVAPEMKKLGNLPTNLKLTHIKLLQTATSYNIYSSILSVDTALQTKTTETKSVLASLIYIKTDKTLKGIECSNKPI